jgi:two-component system response regulator AtoC
MPHDQDPTTSVLQTFTTPADAVRTEPCASLLIYHRDGSEMVPLGPAQPQVVIGRARPSDVPIRDASLSRQHARFELVGTELWVEDLNSTNGTRVNGKRVKRSRVKETDDVQLGAVSVVYHVLAPREPDLAGMDSHDRFLVKLDQELVRARTFARPLALLMVGAAKRKQGHVSRFGPRVRALLRPVDLIALYDQSTVLIALVEVGQQEAHTLARAVMEGRQRKEPELVCGIAVYPEHGTSIDELVETVRAALHQATGRQPVRSAEGAGEPHGTTEGAPVVVNPKMRQIFETARRIADSNIPVLIYGETGTGKEVLARAVHGASRRRRKPLRCINCAAIPEQLVESALFGHERGAFTSADQRRAGVFEEADGGTVMLDEVGELSPSAQAALLRVIETKRVSRVGSSKDFEVDVRILAATHRDLERMCQEGTFRSDLFYRLDSMVFRLPPLRERRDEIIPLAQTFMAAAAKANACKVNRIDPKAEKLLRSYDWPGNVRELRNVIERAVVIAQEGMVTADDLSERVRRGLTPETQPMGALDDDGLSVKEKVKRYESQLLLEALQANDWNQTRTADALGMPLRTLVHKMKVLGLKKRYDSG